MAFYNPITTNINGKIIITYIDEGTEKILGNSNIKFIEHLTYIINKSSKNAEYYIVFLWKDENDLMSDLWHFDKINERPSGPLVDVTIYRNKIEENNIGIGSGNTLIILGLEEENRRNNSTMERYYNNRPKTNSELRLNKNFF